MKTRYDSGATGHHFKEGDQVWMYTPKRRRGLSPKLQQNWEGPYTIVKKLNDVIYRVQRSPNAKPKIPKHGYHTNFSREVLRVSQQLLFNRSDDVPFTMINPRRYEFIESLAEIEQ
ncbi:hypothetical protein AVEN_269004-1 [Araneus ventricosus]|uniref:Integrase p58-like C-terminal domain-containing protein n=1 Tax=Araneus ventricosus TaxID=182803 RepID=A0A4Y2CT66_ARAVE|nr:hypothetical protein AVEN_269004-1 [Araneus ventricosus]